MRGKRKCFNIVYIISVNLPCFLLSLCVRPSRVPSIYDLLLQMERLCVGSPKWQFDRTVFLSIYFPYSDIHILSSWRRHLVVRIPKIIMTQLDTEKGGRFSFGFQVCTFCSHFSSFQKLVLGNKKSLMLTADVTLQWLVKQIEKRYFYLIWMPLTSQHIFSRCLEFILPQGLLVFESGHVYFTHC